jgi:hypothetical protein
MNIGYVIVDRSRASDELRAFAKEAFGLRMVAVEGALELYEPAIEGGRRLPAAGSQVAGAPEGAAAAR